MCLEQGSGFACALALAEEGVDVIINGRDSAKVKDAVLRIDAVGRGAAIAVVADVTTESGRAALIEACPDADIPVTNAGWPPLRDFRQWTLILDLSPSVLLEEAGLTKSRPDCCHLKQTHCWVS